MIVLVRSVDRVVLLVGGELVLIVLVVCVFVCQIVASSQTRSPGHQSGDPPGLHRQLHHADRVQTLVLHYPLLQRTLVLLLFIELLIVVILLKMLLVAVILLRMLLVAKILLWRLLIAVILLRGLLVAVILLRRLLRVLLMVIVLVLRRVRLDVVQRGRTMVRVVLVVLIVEGV